MDTLGGCCVGGRRMSRRGPKSEEQRHIAELEIGGPSHATPAHETCTGRSRSLSSPPHLHRLLFSFLPLLPRIITMGLSVSRLLSGLFGKKEMRMYLPSMPAQPLANYHPSHLFRYIDGSCRYAASTWGVRDIEYLFRLVWTQLVKPPSCTN